MDFRFGTASESFSCRVDLKGFQAQTVEGKRLNQGSIDAPALVDDEGEVMSPLRVRILAGGRGIEFECASPSVSFISLTTSTK